MLIRGAFVAMITFAALFVLAPIAAANELACNQSYVTVEAGGAQVEVHVDCEPAMDLTFMLGDVSPSVGDASIDGGSVYYEASDATTTQTQDTFSVIAEHGSSTFEFLVNVTIVLAPVTCEDPHPAFAIRPEVTRGLELQCSAPQDVSLTYAIVSEPDHEFATVDEVGAGDFHITGVAEGSTVMTVRVTSEYDTTGVLASIPINVSNLANEPPSSCYADYTSTRVGTTRTISVTCNDLDGDEMIIEAIPIDGVTRGVIGDSIPDGNYALSVEYSAPELIGDSTDKFAVLASDGFIEEPVEFVIDVELTAADSNQDPICDESYVTVTAGAAPTAVGPSCTDPDGDNLVYSIAVAPTKGTATEVEGVLYYQADAEHAGEQDTFDAIAADGLGGTATFTVNANIDFPTETDLTAPDTTITSGPAAGSTTAASTGTFWFTSPDIDATAFECRLDSGPFETCTAPWHLSALAAGVHTFQVRAIDTSDNVDATPATRTWTVDPASTTQVSTTLEAGDSTATGSSATPSQPVVIAVEVPVAGTVTVTQNPAPTQSAPSGYSMLGAEFSITAPDATDPAQPLRLTFNIDASVLPAGVDPLTLTMTRNGVAITDACAGETAVPSPCVRSRKIVEGGDLQIVVLTMQASAWQFARLQKQDETDDPPPTDEDPPPATKVATRLAAVSSRVVRYRCPRALQRQGVRFKGVSWCFRSVTRGAVVRTDTGARLGSQRLTAFRIVGTRRVLVGRATSSAAGAGVIRAQIVVPLAHRKSMVAANRWLGVQYQRVQVRHAAGTGFVSAKPRTVRVLR
jgi:hypothetical protein